ncbi:acyl-CoA thioesterase II [Amycolatopsis balhimycina DSM 5908]|uniref:Acyl-CoA thioesterase 2 n=1 Tax=Amycolatopsis balhimycina DSM 5908 TaxID=1081091 RepID=A0A428WVG4_AMYBA|nr:acyl-CoA thioesterase II [Amycolatopsis balhimycina]RSM47069.1 acyl-CoA thioesterase II [Amycolatopsis balhimycina DSM 5908]
MTGAPTRPVHDPARAALLELVGEILDLEHLEVDLFRGRSPRKATQRVFGGQVAGQALVAAGRTVARDRPVHSLHGYFVRPGRPATPIVYRVHRIRDGRSFTTRRVDALQHGETIFTMSASFHGDEPGLAHQETMPAAPPPESLPTPREAFLLAGRDTPRNILPFDLRRVGEDGWRAGTDPARTTQVWLRAADDLGDDPLLHACLLTYASDLTLLSGVTYAHRLEAFGADDGRVAMASLDHAIWFHRPFRVDDWLLFDQDSPTAGGGRGLARGHFFDRDGRHVASAVQEGLVRVRPQ